MRLRERKQLARIAVVLSLTSRLDHVVLNRNKLTRVIGTPCRFVLSSPVSYWRVQRKAASIRDAGAAAPNFQQPTNNREHHFDDIEDCAV